MSIETLNIVTYSFFAGGSLVWCFGFALFAAAILHEVVTNWSQK